MRRAWMMAAGLGLSGCVPDPSAQVAAPYGATAGVDGAGGAAPIYGQPGPYDAPGLVAPGYPGPYGRGPYVQGPYGPGQFVPGPLVVPGGVPGFGGGFYDRDRFNRARMDRERFEHERADWARVQNERALREQVERDRQARGAAGRPEFRPAGGPPPRPPADPRAPRAERDQRERGRAPWDRP